MYYYFIPEFINSSIPNFETLYYEAYKLVKKSVPGFYNFSLYCQNSTIPFGYSELIAVYF
jgi:hypothetical protein